MWEVITNIASICSIIALPIAIWQILDLKSKVKSTENGIKRVLEIKEHEKLDDLANIISAQYTAISNLIPKVSQKGASTQNLSKKCQEINEEISRCIVEIPPQYTEILKSFKESIRHIESFVESNGSSNSELKEARDYLNNAMQSLKRESKKFEDKTIDLASHYNE